MIHIEEFGIYDLRNYARILGVNFPTTKNREQLLKEISLNKENGETNIKKSTRGRPTKALALSLENNMLTKFENKEVLLKIKRDIELVIKENIIFLNSTLKKLNKLF